MKFLFIILFLAISVSCFAGVTATWQNGGWNVVASYTNPNDIAGTSQTLTLTETTEIDGAPITGTTYPDVIVGLTVPTNIIKKIWTTKVALANNLTFIPPTVTADGNASILGDGKLQVFVNAPNDGANHAVSFRLVYKSWVLTNNINKKVNSILNDPILTIAQKEQKIQALLGINWG